MVSNTGFVFVGELLITCRILEVAVCCSSASLVSLNSRTFSIAITAWSAKLSTRAICCGVKGSTSRAGKKQHANRGALAQERYPKSCSIAAKLQHPSQMIFGVILQIGHLGHTSLDQRPADNRSTPGFDG